MVAPRRWPRLVAATLPAAADVGVAAGSADSMITKTFRSYKERYSKPHVIEKKKRPRAASNASS
jgi:hypothetical protein